MKPIEEVLPREERERRRREALAKTPRWYVPWMHVAMPGLFGLGVATAALSRVHDLRPWQIGFFVFVLLLSNATEWRVHRDLLHHRFRPLAELYDRHTPEHHMIFVQDDMALRSAREVRLVLIPAERTDGKASGDKEWAAAHWTEWARQAKSVESVGDFRRRWWLQKGTGFN